MSKELTFTDDNTVKYLDTSSSFDLAITQDGTAFDLTNATAIDVKVANASGYVFDKSIDMATVTQPLAGVITMPVDAEVMNALTPDDYSIEVWVTLSSLVTPGSQEGVTDDDTTESTTTSTTSSYTAIFPSDDTVGFTINSNLTNVDGETVDAISLASFEGELNGKVNTADTVDWQKTKITADSGAPSISISTDSIYTTMSKVTPGFYSTYISGSPSDNPFNGPLKGYMFCDANNYVIFSGTLELTGQSVEIVYDGGSFYHYIAPLAADIVHTTGAEEVSGQKTFDVAPIDKTTGNPYITKDSIPAGGDGFTNIADGTDLNALTTIGRYWWDSSSYSTGLTNYYVNSATQSFILNVINVGSDINQTIYLLNGMGKATRLYNTSTSTWGSWSYSTAVPLSSSTDSLSLRLEDSNYGVSGSYTFYNSDASWASGGSTGNLNLFTNGYLINKKNKVGSKTALSYPLLTSS